MGRKGGSRIDHDCATKIAEKLDAEIERAGAHVTATVRVDGVIVVTFGIRHSKKAKNGHLPKELHIGEGDAFRLGTCTMSREQYYERLRRKGLLPPARAEGNEGQLDQPPQGGQTG